MYYIFNVDIVLHSCGKCKPKSVFSIYLTIDLSIYPSINYTQTIQHRLCVCVPVLGKLKGNKEIGVWNIMEKGWTRLALPYDYSHALQTVLHWNKKYAFLNPIKAGGSESIYRLGEGVPRPPPPFRKMPYKIGIGLKCMFIAKFFNSSSLKKKLDR